jgi:hypothetical protein
MIKAIRKEGKKGGREGGKKRWYIIPNSKAILFSLGETEGSIENEISSDRYSREESVRVTRGDRTGVRGGL